jgi:hypothetical protein
MARIYPVLESMETNAPGYSARNQNLFEGKITAEPSADCCIFQLRVVLDFKSGYKITDHLTLSEISQNIHC